MRVAQRIAAQSVPPDSVAIWWLGQNSYLLRAAGADIMIADFAETEALADYLFPRA